MDAENCIPLREFEEWFARNSKEELQLYVSDVSRQNDGGTCLELGFGTDEKAFKVICSKGYPDVSNIIVSACSDRYSQAVAQINKHISDVGGSVKLPGIFGKSLEIFTSLARNAKQGPKSTCSDSDFEDFDTDDCNGKQSDVEMATESDALDDENFTTEFDFKMDLYKKRWMVKEKEMRAKLKAEKAQVNKQFAKPKTSTAPTLKWVKGVVSVNVHGTESDHSSSDEDMHQQKVPVKAGRQIFSHKDATFQILSNEMISLIWNGKDEGFDCNTVDDSLYKWQIKLRNFEPNSPLTNDLKQLKKNYGFDYVEIELDFVPDFPFYPPMLRIVRPRFQGSLVQSLANIDLLKLTYWNPAKTVRDVLRLIKDILSKHAKIDLNNDTNDMKKNPTGAYLPLEDYLIKLALASEVRPRANFDIIDVENLPKAPSVKNIAQSDKETKNFWAKGSGYGSGRTTRVGWSPETYLKAQHEKDRQIFNILSNILAETKNVIGHVNDEELFAIFEGSALIPYFEDLLKTFSESSIEICHKFELFKNVLNICEQFVDHSFLNPLLCELPRQEHGIVYWLEKINTINQEGQKLSEKVVEPALKRQHLEPNTSNSVPQTSSEADMEYETIRMLSALCNKTKEKSLANRRCDVTPKLPENKPQDDFEANYKTVLYPLQCKTCSFASLDTPWKHHYMTNHKKTDYKNEIRFIWKERISLQNSLPVSSSSAIFLRYDDDNTHLLRFMITGPEDTPYANGCFIFDFCYPPNYPNAPPLVNLQTTGGNRVRFNPNLYNSGKVCLSLLGTWSGDKGENWNPKTSTTLQVLISIQSLIFHDKPYFNEPGYETTIGTEKGEKASATYNKEVRKNCLNIAMVDSLQNPPPGFEDAIKLHYKLKKDKILEQLNKWLGLDATLEGPVNTMKKLLDELK